MTLLDRIKQETILEGGAVYFDSVNGVAGTAHPIGTAQTPVNNETDLLAIIAARNLDKVVLRNPATVLQFTGGLSNIIFTSEGGAGELAPTVDFNLQAIACQFFNLRITDTAGDNVSSPSWFQDCDILTVIADDTDGAEYHRCRFYDGTENPPLGIIYCYDCRWRGEFDNSTGNVRVYGDLDIGDNLTNDSGDISIQGNLHAGADVTNNSGNISVYGNCQVREDLNNDTGLIEVLGNCHAGGNLINATGNVYIRGNCQADSSLINGTGNIIIEGDCHAATDVIMATAGVIRVYGKLQVANNIENAGTLDCSICLTRPNPTLYLLLSAVSVTERIVSRGNLTVAQMVAGATAIIDLCGGILTIAATCTGGVIDLYGDCKLVDLAGGAVTVNDYRIPGHTV